MSKEANTQIITAIDLKCDEYIKLTKEKTEKTKKPFRMIGNGDSMNAYRMTLEMVKDERYVMSVIIDSFCDWDTGIYYVKTKELTPAQRVSFSKGYTKLKNKKVLLRIGAGKGQSQYIVNPEFFIPRQIKKAKELWRQTLSEIEFADKDKIDNSWIGERINNGTLQEE